MRKTTIAVFSAAALYAVSAVPVSATPLACADPCRVVAHGFGYVPPVQEIASGTEVEWRSDDKSHPTADAARSFDEQCFLVSVGQEVEPVPVRFEVTNGAVEATSDPGGANQTTKTCTSAVEVQDGTYLLPFRCVIHPWMWGGLVIQS